MTPTREEVERPAKRFDVNAADWRWDEDHHAARDMLRALLARAEAAEADRDALRPVSLQMNRMAAERDAARAEAARLREALLRIERWEMPRTGRYHPNGDEQSYSWCYGSNGEREVIRSIARAALATEARDNA